MDLEKRLGACSHGTVWKTQKTENESSSGMLWTFFGLSPWTNWQDQTVLNHKNLLQRTKFANQTPVHLECGVKLKGKKQLFTVRGSIVDHTWLLPTQHETLQVIHIESLLRYFLSGAFVTREVLPCVCVCVFFFCCCCCSVSCLVD